jgi:hypothetical protein
VYCAVMTNSNEVVFLFDVDNTLLVQPLCGYALCHAASGFDSNTLPFDGRLIVGEAAGIDRKGQFNEIDRFAK